MPRPLVTFLRVAPAALLLATGCAHPESQTPTPAKAPLGSWHSVMVQPGPDGRLSYPADEQGNRIPDFSHAGYRGGGVPLPEVPVVATLAPAPGDNTARLQAALDALGELPLQPSGHRGALLLEPGVFEVSATILIRHSGIVLRGSGSGSGEDPARDTLIHRVGRDTSPVLVAGGTAPNDKFRSALPDTRADIVTPFVQVGSRAFEVADPSLYSVGDAIIIEHPATQAWIDALDGGGTHTDPPWQLGERESEMHIRYLRRVTAIDGATLRIDAPVYNHLDRSLAQSFVYRHDDSEQLSEIGVEHLRITIDHEGPETETHARDALVFRRAQDCWARDVAVLHFVAAGVKFGPAFARGTALDCHALEPRSRVTGARRYNFCVFEAQLVLFENCTATDARHAFIANGTTLDSGIVVLDCVNLRSTAPSEGHRRWGQALLFDNFRTIDPVGSPAIIGLHNRGSWGVGHGWGSAHSVAWNSDTGRGRLIVHRPPTAQNYAIGCTGDVTPVGYFDVPGGHIEGTAQPGLVPASLYRAQLAERLRNP